MVEFEWSKFMAQIKKEKTKTPEEMRLFIESTIVEAGEATVRLFGRDDLESSTKEDESDWVTQADIASSEIIIDRIKKAFPDDGIIDEETGEYQTDSESVWIVDPLDGTFNFKRNIPIFGVSIALVENNVVTYGAIYDPIHQQMLFAQKDKGAFLNGQETHCSNREEWPHSAGCVGSKLAPDRINFFNNLLKAASEETIWFEANASIVISSMLLAVGSLDWYFSPGGKIWDYAAASLILTEAGCRVTNLAGKNWSLGDKEMVAANEFLHGKILEIAQR
ncbi:inositol monophosphatase family protein [Patescibacteria group bacterium]